MTDYLIDQYNDKIAAAMKIKDDAIAAATQTWHTTLDDILGVWSAGSASAAIELATALEHRNKVYVEGPAPIVMRKVERAPFVIDDDEPRKTNSIADITREETP